MIPLQLRLMFRCSLVKWCIQKDDYSISGEKNLHQSAHNNLSIAKDIGDIMTKDIGDIMTKDIGDIMNNTGKWVRKFRHT